MLLWGAMRSLSFACLASAFVLAACATTETDGTDLIGGSSSGGNNPGGAPATGGTAPSGGGGDAPVGGEGGASSACTQDCSTIEVPDCYEAICNEETGNCDIAQAADDTPCEDGAFCTVDDTCQAGECEPGGAMDCTGGNDPCLVPSCNEDLDTCDAASAQNGTACTSADICLTNTICLNGACQGAPLDCSGTPLDSPECQAAACDPTTGQCVISPVNDGAPCTFGDICESEKVCDVGECLGTPIPSCTGCTESEPNETYSTANVGVGCASWAGGITVIGDHDCFAIDVTVPGSRIAASTTDIGGAGCPAGFDSVIRLFNSAGTEIASDDQSGDVSCSAFLPTQTATTNLAVGTYYVCVEDWLNNGTSPPYLLLLSALAPGCGDAIVNAAEECDGTNLAGQTCVTQGFGSGTLTCDASCAFDTSACAAPFCGDALVNAAEDCDGANLGGANCVSQGFAGGTLACDASCAFVTGGCVASGCGNGLLEFGEDCDGGAGCSPTCTLACGGGQVPFSVTGTGLPIAITDNATFTSTAPVGVTGTIASVGVQININHTYDGDLDISIASPTPPSVDLSSDNGGTNENYINTVFSAAATTNITAGVAPYTGLFLPEGSLAGFNGQTAAGNWTLTVTDDLGGDVGTLNNWRVFGCVNP